MVAESKVREIIAESGADPATVLHVLARHGLVVAEAAEILIDGPIMTGGWPYPDLSLKTPHCPHCGSPAALMTGSNVHPMAFCPNDDCRAWTWDPSQSAAELLAHQLDLGDASPVVPTERDV